MYTSSTEYWIWIIRTFTVYGHGADKNTKHKDTCLHNCVNIETLQYTSSWYRVLSCSAADTAWSLLQHYLRTHEDNTAQLHRTVVVRLLSQGFPLPSWLIKSYKVCNIYISIMPRDIWIVNLTRFTIFICRHWNCIYYLNNAAMLDFLMT